jgi:adenylate cyclase
MPQETERKFLLTNDSWKTAVVRRLEIKQGYLNTDPKRTVRVRLKGDTGILTIKSESVGISREEYEYEIPYEEARSLIRLCEPPVIDKVRHEVRYEGHLWEIDVFAGANEGLTVAEIELSTEDEAFAHPEWLGQEVSDDPRYFNSQLVACPFCDW